MFTRSQIMIPLAAGDIILRSAAGSEVTVAVGQHGFAVSNSGTSPLDAEMLFRRFYLPSGRREGSTGLGLALAHAVCSHSGLDISYSYSGNMHTFAVILKKSK